MTTREELVSLRKEFEQYYVTHAFDYAANPIGSRDCSVMWEGYKAGAASRDAEIHRLQMALADTEALELGTSEKCDQLREQLAEFQQSEFNPDWSLLQASQEALREHMQMVQQLREQVAMLREALKDICSDYEDRFDMDSSSTNPGMKFVVKQAREVLDVTEPKP